MQIKQTTLNQVTSYTATVSRTAEPQKKSSAKDTSSADAGISKSAWQKEILMQALDKLENSRHLDNNHPLDRDGAAPIEDYEEALDELKMINPENFAKEAYGAQANINPQDVVYLFMND